MKQCDCGSEMEWVDCDGWCQDGWVDEYDDDPINYAEGEEFRKCSQCLGRGGWWACMTPEKHQQPPVDGQP